MSDIKFITTGVGRIVQGDVFVGQDTNAEGNPLVIKNGPNAGQPRKDYFIALAIKKTDPLALQLVQAIHAEAAAAFPTLFGADGKCVNDRFAFKYTDGDSTVPNTKGVVPNSREGFPGHYVFNFSSGYAPTAYTKGGDAKIVNHDDIKRGYFVRVYCSIKGNGSTQQPGIFLNHSMVELSGYGEEITSGPAGADVFGGGAGALPAGASATPLAPAVTIAQPLTEASPVPPVAVVPAPITPEKAVPLVPPVAVVPAPEFLNPPPVATPPPVDPVEATIPPYQPSTPPTPAEAQYDLNGNTVTREQLIIGGWTDAQISTLPKAPVVDTDMSF